MIDTGEDNRTICRAWTGGDGDHYLMVEFNDGDAPPPDNYPTVFFRELTVRGIAPLLASGEIVTMTVDGGHVYRARVDVERGEDGIPIVDAHANADDMADMLRAMARGNRLTVRILDPARAIFEASLHGFTAVYRKMADWCGFETMNVL